MIDDSNNILVKVSGRVQGVGFRAWAKKKADKLKLTGWVRNCQDKTVECELSGKKKNIELFLNACKDGPILSNVNNICSKKSPFKKFDSFTIYY